MEVCTRFRISQNDYGNPLKLKRLLDETAPMLLKVEPPRVPHHSLTLILFQLKGKKVVLDHTVVESIEYFRSSRLFIFKKLCSSSVFRFHCNDDYAQVVH